MVNVCRSSREVYYLWPILTKTGMCRHILAKIQNMKFQDLCVGSGPDIHRQTDGQRRDTALCMCQKWWLLCLIVDHNVHCFASQDILYILTQGVNLLSVSHRCEIECFVLAGVWKSVFVDDKNDVISATKYSVYTHTDDSSHLCINTNGIWIQSL